MRLKRMKAVVSMVMNDRIELNGNVCCPQANGARKLNGRKRAGSTAGSVPNCPSGVAPERAEI